MEVCPDEYLVEVVSACKISNILLILITNWPLAISWFKKRLKHLMPQNGLFAAQNI